MHIFRSRIKGNSGKRAEVGVKMGVCISVEETKEDKRKTARSKKIKRERERVRRKA